MEHTTSSTRPFLASAALLPEAELVRLGPGELMAEAAALGEQLRQCALRQADGSTTWTGPFGYGTPGVPLRIQKVGPHLYQGTCGIALYLAALDSTGTGTFSDLCRGALRPLRRKLSSLTANPSSASQLDLGIGGMIGLGSLVYGLVTIGELLEEPELITEAHALTRLFTPERIRGSGRVWVQIGAAGAILALLALHRRAPGPNQDGKTPLELARECGMHVAQSRVVFEGFPAAWPLSPGKPPLVGFCYGAAGICHALARLCEEVDEPAFREALNGGLDFLRALYSPERGAWWDVRYLFQRQRGAPSDLGWRDWWAFASDNVDEPSIDTPIPESPGRPPMVSKWCHGAAGIVLGKVASLPFVDNVETRQEIESGLRFVLASVEPEEFSRHDPDDLCCGHMGHVESLLQAGRLLGDPGLIDAAQALVTRVVLRSRERGGYVFNSARGTGAFSPSLFQGSAGIGYTLLRCAAPDRLPCLLLME